MESLPRNSGNGLIEFFKREKGLCSPRNYTRRISASKTLIEHIDQYWQLNSQQRGFSSLAFNTTGEFIISGELIISAPNHDKHVMFWEWETNKLISSYPSGQLSMLLQAKSMPLTDDRKIITSASDGQVSLIECSDNGASCNKILSQHHGIVGSLAVEPGSPYNFYSCGEDGFIKHYDLRNCSVSDLFYCPSYEEPNQRICLSSMVIDPGNPNYFAAGGEDEFARVYDLRRFRVNSSTNEGSPVSVFCPQDHSPYKDDVKVVSLDYSSMSELLVTYSDRTINLFQWNMGYPSIEFFYSSIEYQSDQQVYKCHRNLNEEETLTRGCFFGPNAEYIISGSDNGCVFIWEKKSCMLLRLMVADPHLVDYVLPHPLIPVFATGGSECNIKIWGRPSDKPAIQIDKSNCYVDDIDELDSASLRLLRERSAKDLPGDD